MIELSSYRQAEEYILGIPKFTRKNTWEQTRKFYEFLGRPGSSSLLLHVAGTNGKGSVCAYMASCLKQAGISAGMFTSPHLVTMRERIRLNGEMISEEDFLQVFHGLKEALEEYRRAKNREEYHPTFFEFLFFINMLYMEEKKPEAVILETGLGGRLDATNVIDPPKVCIITEIGMDHMEYLGNTLTAIAGEKAGIIKPGSTVVYRLNRQETAAVIEQKASACGCFCRSVSERDWQTQIIQHKKIDFSYHSRYDEYVQLTLPQAALYQVENVCLALAALEESGLGVGREAVQEGVRLCRWEGRMEEVLPDVFLDGAHNEDGIDAFLAAVREDGCAGQRWLLFSAVADKEYAVMKDKLAASGLFSHIYTAPLHNARGLAKEELEQLFTAGEAVIADNAGEGLEEILSGKKEGDLVYAAGSLYLVGELKEWLLDKSSITSGQ
jgi:dihydrofolate synthase/folylpolyglutamate synthase